MYWKLDQYRRTVEDTQALLSEADYGQQEPQMLPGVQQKQLINTRAGVGGMLKQAVGNWLGGKQNQQVLQKFPAQFQNEWKQFSYYYRQYQQLKKSDKPVDTVLGSLQKTYKALMDMWNQFYNSVRTKDGVQVRPDQAFDQKTNAIHASIYKAMSGIADKAITDPQGYKYQQQWGGGAGNEGKPGAQRRTGNKAADAMNTLVGMATQMSQATGEKVSHEDVIDALTTPNVQNAIRAAILDMPQQQAEKPAAQPQQQAAQQKKSILGPNGKPVEELPF